MIEKKVETITTYHCTECDDQEIEESDIRKCSKCGEKGCTQCIQECGKDDKDEDCKVKGCHKIFCTDCCDISPWDLLYCLLCNDCIEKNKVQYWYGPEAFEKSRRNELREEGL